MHASYARTLHGWAPLRSTCGVVILVWLHDAKACARLVYTLEYALLLKLCPFFGVAD